MRSDEESGQTIIAGMGELHLEIIVDRMKREFGVEANVGKPQVAYRETIAQDGWKRRGRQVRAPVRVARASTVTWCSVWSRTKPARASKFCRRNQGRCGAARIHPCGGKGVIEALLPACWLVTRGGREGHADLRFVPRCGLVRTGVQDGRHLRLQGRLPRRPARHPGAHDAVEVERRKTTPVP